ncbi:hypothetical protein E4U28_006567 [Claviceps purpurea]|nr:hypothetical protein E4U28_006567 [Claviceps purpurea]
MGGWLIFGHISLFWRARAQLDLRRRRAPPEDGTGAAARRVTPRLEQRLVRGDFLDSTCPTVTLHCQDKAGESGYKLQIYNKRHPVSHPEWLSLLQPYWIS